MNKFLLMIFSVSIFFIGLGGIVKQVDKLFAEDETNPTVYRRIPGDENLIPPPDEDKNVVIVKRRMENPSEFNIKIQPPPIPNQPDAPFVFERQPSNEPLEQGAELPRVSEKQIVILQNKNVEEKKTSNPDKVKNFPGRVLIDKDKKPE